MEKSEAGAILSVDLGAIASNWLTLNDVMKGRGAAAAVVKSDAYGLGAEEVASALLRRGCTDFFVAYLSEGITLRKKLGSSPKIYVLHGNFAGTEKTFPAYNLIPVLNTIEQIDGWLAFTAEVGHRFPCALHFDTGMSRMGIPAYDRWQLLGDKSDKLKALNVDLVMSHIANGDDEKSAVNAQQLSTFRQIKDLVIEHLGYRPKFSFSATAGLILGGNYLFDLARPGCGLYGFLPSPDMHAPFTLTPAISLDARILQVQATKTGQTVGYGSTYRFYKDGKLATAALGYADGFRRSLSNQGYGYIGNYKVPVVGRVSMDLTTFDVSEVPEQELAKTSKVEIIGKHISLDEVAANSGTVAYEVITDLGARYYRQYVGEVLSLSLPQTGFEGKGDS